MPRLKPLDLADLPTDLQEELSGFNEFFVPNSLLVMARDPELVRKHLNLMKYIMRPDGKIPYELKVMLAAVGSFKAGCMYCTAHTGHVGESLLDTEKFLELWNFEDSKLFTSEEKVALKFAFLASGVPNEVNDEDINQLRLYWSESQIVEIMAVISMMGFMNRWNDSLAIPLEDAPKSFAAKSLKHIGWNAGKHDKY